MKEPILFSMYRRSDAGGVSGLGRVLDGAVFHTGQVVVCWRTDVDASRHGHSSIGVYADWDTFKFIHMESHPTNKTEIVWQTDKNSRPVYPFNNPEKSVEVLFFQ